MNDMTDPPSSDLDAYPVVECPRCHKEQTDMDGFGFLACIPGCGHCTHPSCDKVDGLWRCGICGKLTEVDIG